MSQKTYTVSIKKSKRLILVRKLIAVIHVVDKMYSSLTLNQVVNTVTTLLLKD
jgi:hypothetical protein